MHWVPVCSDRVAQSSSVSGFANGKAHGKLLLTCEVTDLWTS